MAEPLSCQVMREIKQADECGRAAVDTSRGSTGMS